MKENRHGCIPALSLTVLLGLLLTLKAGPKDITDDSASAESAALALAESARPADHATLRQQLRSEDFLARLDSASATRGTRQPRPLLRVLQTLSSNKTTSARQVLIDLTQDGGFNEDADRTDALIRACAAVRPPPPELISFWDQHCQPDDGFTPLTIPALVENGSGAALALFEKKMASDRFTADDKTGWMRSAILTHRNDLAVLRSCQRLLEAKLPAELRPALVEVLFDYKPTEWFPPDNLLRPPERARASREARAKLRELGTWALRHVSLTEPEKAAVRRTLDDLDKAAGSSIRGVIRSG